MAAVLFTLLVVAVAFGRLAELRNIVEALGRVTELPFDAHLMIAEPGRWLDAFLGAGCDSVTFHVELEPAQIRPTLERTRAAGRPAASWA